MLGCTYILLLERWCERAGTITSGLRTACKPSYRYSLASIMPSGPMQKLPSLSGSDGDPTILQTRFSPLPFFSHKRVVVACAMMLPPIGLMEGPANMLPPSRFAATTYRIHGVSWLWQGQEIVFTWMYELEPGISPAGCSAHQKSPCSTSRLRLSPRHYPGGLSAGYKLQQQQTEHEACWGKGTSAAARQLLTWFVTTTAQPNSSARRCRERRKRPRWI